MRERTPSLSGPSVLVHCEYLDAGDEATGSWRLRSSDRRRLGNFLRRVRWPRPAIVDGGDCLQFGSPRRLPTQLGLRLLFDQGLEVVAAQFASRVGLAVDERSLRLQHLHGVTPVVWVAPPEVWGDRAVAPE